MIQHAGVFPLETLPRFLADNELVTVNNTRRLILAAASSVTTGRPSREINLRNFTDIKSSCQVIKVPNETVINDGLQNPFNRLLHNINNAVPETTDSVHSITERIRDSLRYKAREVIKNGLNTVFPNTTNNA